VLPSKDYDEFNFDEKFADAPAVLTPPADNDFESAHFHGFTFVNRRFTTNQRPSLSNAASENGVATIDAGFVFVELFECVFFCLFLQC
jgi:hypothetical protein